jgi:type 2A phosphatase activator TIP41
MFFGANSVSIQKTNPARVTLHFNAMEAIRTVSKTAASVPVRIAAGRAHYWQEKSESEPVFDYDWTFTPTNYHGSLHTEGFAETEDTEDFVINYRRLKDRTEPVLFFAENILYEDELGDNGISSVSVRLRVMQFGWYCLFTIFLRVDQVTFKATTVRYYHEFDTQHIVKEVKKAEGSYESIVTLIGTANIRDVDAVMAILPAKIISNTVLFCR